MTAIYCKPDGSPICSRAMDANEFAEKFILACNGSELGALRLVSVIGDTWFVAHFERDKRFVEFLGRRIATFGMASHTMTLDFGMVKSIDDSPTKISLAFVLLKSLADPKNLKGNIFGILMS